MAKERPDSEKKEKKEEKHKHSETNGVRKDKSSKAEKEEKKEKKRAKEAAKAAGAKIESASRPAADKENVKPAVAEEVDLDGNAVAGDAEIKEDDKEEVKKQLIIGSAVPFANPMADDKTMRRVLRGVKKASKHKTIRRGVKEVVKSLRKSPLTASKPPNAVVILAADISPFDVISHIPVLCEDHHIPYVYVPSRAELGAAGNTKRPTSVIMVVPTVPAAQKAAMEKAGKEDKEDWAETYADLVKVVEKASRDVRI